MMIQKILILFVFIGFPSAYAMEINQRVTNSGSGSGEKPKITTKAIRYQKSFHTYSKIPDFELVDMYGKKINLASLIDGERSVLLNFIFTTCPSFCPILSATFGKVQNEINSDDLKTPPLLISISIDPEHDTPERLKKYASKFKSGPNWIFLTGNHDVILKVQHIFNVYKGEKMNHQPVTFLHRAKDSNWLRLDGFTSAKNLLFEFQQLLSK